MGELFSKLNPSTGEFDNPYDYAEYARLTAELGNNPNTRLGTGFGARELENRIAAEERAGEARSKRDAERITREKAAADAKTKEKENSDAERKFISIGKTGSSLVRVSAPAGAGKFYRLLTEGGNNGSVSVSPFNQALGFSRVTDETKGLPAAQQKRVTSQGLVDWIKNSGYASKARPVEIEEMLRNSGTDLEDERKAVAAELMRLFKDQNISEDDINDITDRIIASELTTLHQKHKTTKDPVVRVTGEKELEKVLLEQAALPPEQRAKSVIYRARVKGKLSEKYNYQEFTLEDLLNGRNNPEHPLFGR